MDAMRVRWATELGSGSGTTGIGGRVRVSARASGLPYWLDPDRMNFKEGNRSFCITVRARARY